MARRSPAKVIGGRLLQALPVILLATFMVFALLKLVPGDIAVTLAGDNATDARITEIQKIYGLDRPFLVQYGAWLANVVQGDLSQSLLTGEKVATSIARAFPNTLLIVAIALVLALVTGIPMGVIAAIKPNGWVDKTVSMIASLGVAVPGFWLAMILVAEISLKLNWLPATGAKSFSASPWEAIRHALLPGIAIAAYGMAEVARQLRGSLLEVLSSQYVRTLHAKGLSMTRILWQHGLKNVSVNLFTIISLLVNRMLAATVVIEAVFAIPGFWLAMILVAEISLKLNWLPATGAKSFSVAPVEAIRHALLPGIAIAAYGMAEVARQLRGSLLEVLSSQYVRTLHAKGLSMTRILWQHGLKNVSVNLFTIIGVLVNRMLAATVVIEAVFAIPGLGSLIVRGAIQRDFPIVQGVVFTMVIVVIMVNLIADLLCAAVDPRIER